MIPELLLNLLLALVFGATVGLERESSNPNDPHVGGIRTFSLIALMGALAGIFYQHHYESFALIIVIPKWVNTATFGLVLAMITLASSMER